MAAASPVIETIRNGLIGALNDFVHDAGFQLQLNLIVELAYELAEYREEGVPYFPSVYLVKRTDEADTLSIIAPGAERIFLKNIAVDEGSASQILKDSAALADGGWSVFVDVSDEEAKYGLFRSELLPISLSSAEHMADPVTESGSALLIRNCARNCVELLAADGQRLEFGLTASRPTEDSVSESFRILASQATSHLPKGDRAAANYIERIVTQVCQRSHGTIIAVLASGADQVPESFSDGVVLQEPIDLLGALSDLREETTASTLARLSAIETVLRGMIQSDGITVLSASGRVMAFRVFVKPSEQEREAMDAMDVRGGARSRAFELLKLRIGKTISCAFFRSQDGNTKCVV